MYHTFQPRFKEVSRADVKIRKSVFSFSLPVAHIKPPFAQWTSNKIEPLFLSFLYFVKFSIRHDLITTSHYVGSNLEQLNFLNNISFNAVCFLCHSELRWLKRKSSHQSYLDTTLLHLTDITEMKINSLLYCCLLRAWKNTKFIMI